MTALTELADIYATPLYVYDLDVIRDRARQLQAAFTWPTKQFCAMKANPCPPVIKALASGFGCDCVSPGESLARRVGVPANRCLPKIT